ncbi:MAG TPA: MFS transporter [Chlamydiales bacterium]|nr:MFS transporter [Chlamydiales bacterium]
MGSMGKKWPGVAAIIFGSCMTFMDQTILPVALPTIQREFLASSISLQWSVNAFLLTIAIFTLVGGKIGDRIGHRGAFLLGMATFALCSALCGISPNIEFLIVARALQGIGAAIMLPSQTALVATLFPPHQRGRASGFMISIGSLFLILGPMIGGYLTEAVSWRWIFWVNLPLAAIGVCLALLFLAPSPPGKMKIDLWGFAFFAIGSATVTLFFMQAQEWHFASAKSLLCAAVALLSLLLLFMREKRTAHPFLDLSLFKRPIYAAINVSISIAQFILMITVFRTVYIQEILAYSPFQTGLIVSISALPVLFGSSIGGYLSDKISPKLPIALGYLSLIASFFWFGFFSTPSLPVLFAASLLFGAGIPLVLTPSYSAAMSAVPQEKLGVAFGMVSTLRSLAGTIGLALINLFVTIVQSNRLPVEGARLAEISSFSAVHFALGILVIIAFVATFFLHGRKSGHHPPNSPAEGWD